MIHRSEVFGFDTILHEADICVIGAGAAGLYAAVAAARHGAKVALMHDRPVVGGNASSEIRMTMRGAKDNMESGIVEEAAMRNLYRNPTLNFSIWDSVTYELVTGEPNIDLMLNCSCLDAEMDGSRIVSVKGWQTTSQKFHTVKAKIFLDCSGDSVLAPLTGAAFRMGRESSDEFGEDILPKESDNCTMGMSCLIEVREVDHPVEFKAPDWAEKFTDETISHRVKINAPMNFANTNFWWIELGGEYDSIGDTEMLRDKLLPIAFGVWDYYKNSGHFATENWELDWVGFLPGKRESRRYEGDHILTQCDVRAEGRLDDIIAYGGWPMDDHHPGGFRAAAAATIFHPAPSPFGIPYRCLYSKNIDNLMFAGRNISCTHAGLSSSRVMSTCAILGQAAGTAASIAVSRGITPRAIYTDGLVPELQQMLMEDDCWIPWHTRALTPVMEGIKATACGADASVVLDGWDRSEGENDHLLKLPFGEALELTLPEARHVEEIRFIFDSDLKRETFGDVNRYNRTYPIRCRTFLHEPLLHLPTVLMRDFDVYTDAGEGWTLLTSVKDNCLRLWRCPVEKNVRGVKLVPKSGWGSDTAQAHVYSAILK